MSGRRTTRTTRRSSRRGPDIRRASAGMNRTRSLALLVVIGSGLAIYGLSASPAFGYKRLDIVGAGRTPESAIRSDLTVPDGTNLFRLSTDGMAERLGRLSTVASATIEIELPDTLRVHVTEREPVVVWQVGDSRFLVDVHGVVFAAADATTGLAVVDDRRIPVAPVGDDQGTAGGAAASPAASAPPSPAASRAASPRASPAASPRASPAASRAASPAASPAASAALGSDAGIAPSPTAGAGFQGLAIGDTIDPVDFDAATRLGSLLPADVGSGAAGLHVRIDDEHGFSVDTGMDGWSAIFGFYTPTIRKTDLIPGQVRLLKSLLAGREETVATIILADDREGTYSAKASP